MQQEGGAFPGPKSFLSRLQSTALAGKMPGLPTGTWCRGLTYLPVTQETASSNLVVPEISYRRDYSRNR
jgi:hypothetical protein